jgi:hypothetical protein
MCRVARSVKKEILFVTALSCRCRIKQPDNDYGRSSPSFEVSTPPTAASPLKTNFSVTKFGGEWISSLNAQGAASRLSHFVLAAAKNGAH